MATKRISELPAAAALTGTEKVEVVQGGVSVRTTAQAIADFGGGSGVGFTYLERTITSAEILNAFSSPVELLPAPGANKAIIPIHVIYSMDHAGATYAANTTILLKIGASVTIQTLSGFLNSATDIVSWFNLVSVTANFINQNMTFGIQTGNPTTGNSDVKLKIWYKEITL